MARGRDARDRRDPTESESAVRPGSDRTAESRVAATAEALDEFAAVLQKMAADTPLGAASPPQPAPEANPCAAAQADQAAPGAGEASPGAVAPEGPTRSFRYGVTDLDARPVTYSIVIPTEGGRITDNGDGTFDFDPGDDFRDLPVGETREVGFTYQAIDGEGGAARRTVTLTVTGTGEGAPEVGGSAVEADALPEAGGGVETVYIDGVSGPPGAGGWTIALNMGEILETNVDNLVLSEDAVGVIILGGDTSEIFFEGIERIAW